MEIYYVLARKSDSEPYQFVSYKREKGTRGPIDIGIALHDAQDFALEEADALEAQQQLEKEGYGTVLARHHIGKDGINLDQILYYAMLDQMMKKKK